MTEGVEKKLVCYCGCKTEGKWLASGTDHGQRFIAEPVCDNTIWYLEMAASEVGDTTFTKTRIA